MNERNKQRKDGRLIPSAILMSETLKLSLDKSIITLTNHRINISFDSKQASKQQQQQTFSYHFISFLLRLITFRVGCLRLLAFDVGGCRNVM